LLCTRRVRGWGGQLALSKGRRACLRRNDTPFREMDDEQLKRKADEITAEEGVPTEEAAVRAHVLDASSVVPLGAIGPATAARSGDLCGIPSEQGMATPYQTCIRLTDPNTSRSWHAGRRTGRVHVGVARDGTRGPTRTRRAEAVAAYLRCAMLRRAKLLHPLSWAGSASLGAARESSPVAGVSAATAWRVHYYPRVGRTALPRVLAARSEAAGRFGASIALVEGGGEHRTMRTLRPFVAHDPRWSSRVL
jgi:hypothetical protein